MNPYVYQVIMKIATRKKDRKFTTKKADGEIARNTLLRVNTSKLAMER